MCIHILHIIYIYDPSTRPQTEFLCKPIRRIMEEKSMTRNHEGGIIGRGIIEKESLGRHRGGEIMEEQPLRREHGGIISGASGSPLGSIWGGFGNHLTSFSNQMGPIWEVFGSHLGAFGELEAEEASGRHLEVRSQKSQHLS